MGDPLACKWCKRKTLKGEPALPLEFEGVHVGVGHRPCYENALLVGLEESIREDVREEHDAKEEYKAKETIIALDMTQVSEGDSITYDLTTWYLTTRKPRRKKS